MSKSSKFLKFRALFMALGVFSLSACTNMDNRQGVGSIESDVTKDIEGSKGQGGLAQARQKPPGAAIMKTGGGDPESDTSEAVNPGVVTSGVATSDSIAPARGNTIARAGKNPDGHQDGSQDLDLVAMIPGMTERSRPGISATELADPTIKLCEEVGKKLGSVSISECLNQKLIHSAFTMSSRSLAFKDYPPQEEREPLGRVLVIGGIHGDEFSSVSVVMKWMGILDQHHSGLFHWRFVPAANPDGLLESKSQRQNRNGVDLNRNFPTADWDTHAIAHWEQVTHRNPRRHPGSARASELETQWLVKQIHEFKPDVIISMHAPYHLVDYDGPPSAPAMLGGLYLRKLGVYPGSLGNYAGIDLKMPIVTVELKSAGIMPTKSEIDRMWIDLVHWLRVQLTNKVKKVEPVRLSELE